MDTRAEPSSFPIAAYYSYNTIHALLSSQLLATIPLWLFQVTPPRIKPPMFNCDPLSLLLDNCLCFVMHWKPCSFPLYPALQAIQTAFIDDLLPFNLLFSEPFRHWQNLSAMILYLLKGVDNVLNNVGPKTNPSIEN